MKSTIVEPTTQALDVPGATLTYDVRHNDQTTEPILLLIGSSMAPRASAPSSATSPTARW